jgi:TRAP-type C4-dicarboxylate transport system permease small subunit
MTDRTRMGLEPRLAPPPDRGEPDPPRAGGPLGALDRAAHGLERALAFVAGLTIFAVMWLLVAVVVLRATVAQPLRGQIDLVQMFIPVLAFLGLAYCYRLDGHVRMDILLRTMSSRVRAAAEILGALVALAAGMIVVLGAGRDAIRAWRFGDSTMDVQLLTWPARAVVAVGAALFVARVALALWGWARVLRDPAAPAVAVARRPPEDDPVLAAAGAHE